MSVLTDSPEWQALVKHQASLSQHSLNELFGDNPNRFADFSHKSDDLLVDFSKNHIISETIDLFDNLSQQAGLKAAISAMFDGETINNTEQRPALHVALRSPECQSEYGQVVHQTLNRMAVFVDAVTRWQWQGFKGDPITDVVNIGIGGSDLGPAMVYTALSDFQLDGIRCHFVSNVDPVHLEETLESLDPATTLFVIASKTFTTMETMLNAQSAKRWLLEACNDSLNENTALAKHFVAVSTNVKKAGEFGIPADNIFPMWDWVGGRYSLWSAIGLPVALGVGMENFRALLDGAHGIDNHFQSTPAKENIPVLMAFVDCWYQNFFATESRVVLPYSQQLHLFPSYLQQLDMESLGKSVTKDGAPVDIDSGGIVWGSAGTNGQHSFHQLLHQGTHLIPADFIAIAKPNSSNKQQHLQLLANCFAQSQALMNGKSLQSATAELLGQGLNETQAALLAPHKVIPGNRPSTTLVLDQLTPHSLGSLIACYEHKVFARSVILGINAFDQWGVELGKVLSKGIYDELVNDGLTSAFDSSTNALINRCK